MKRMLCLILVVLMILSLAACGGEKAEKEGLQVGYGRADITPANGTPLGGYLNGDHRQSTEVMDKLYATCISLYDGKDQVLLITTDVLYTPEAYFVPARKAVSEATGVAEQNIFIAGTHTHSGPDFDYIGTENLEAVETYKQLWIDGCAASAKEALKNQCAATMSGTKFETEYLNYVRHYKQASGAYVGDNFGDINNSTIVDYAEEGDKEMILVKFDREKGKDVLLMNFQAHPSSFTGGIDKTVVSADFIGSVRSMIEKEQDILFAYYTGAAGNQNVITKLPEDNAVAGQFAEIMPYTKEFVRQVNEAMDAGMTPIEGYDVQVNTYTYEGKVNRINEDKLEIAEDLYNSFVETGNRDVYNAKAREAGFLSIYDCRGVIQRAAMPDTLSMEMNAFSVGDLAMVTAPFEMFSVQGTYIKTNSPYDFTVVITCSGSHRSYIPSKLAYEYGCYESTTSYYEAGTAELLAEKYVQMLGELKN